MRGGSCKKTLLRVKHEIPSGHGTLCVLTMWQQGKDEECFGVLEGKEQRFLYRMSFSLASFDGEGKNVSGNIWKNRRKGRLYVKQTWLLSRKGTVTVWEFGELFSFCCVAVIVYHRLMTYEDQRVTSTCFRGWKYEIRGRWLGLPRVFSLVVHGCCLLPWVGSQREEGWSLVIPVRHKPSFLGPHPYDLIQS